MGNSWITNSITIVDPSPRTYISSFFFLLRFFLLAWLSYSIPSSNSSYTSTYLKIQNLIINVFYILYTTIIVKSTCYSRCKLVDRQLMNISIVYSQVSVFDTQIIISGKSLSEKILRKYVREFLFGGLFEIILLLHRYICHLIRW